ncbi:Cupredoxin [Lipomyces oligophaga]|uniref:Cupredoxin n=1 Tax=Lipomyces oligophaga TaxID=45792 RepID=UPI0034CDB80F
MNKVRLKRRGQARNIIYPSLAALVATVVSYSFAFVSVYEYSLTTTSTLLPGAERSASWAFTTKSDPFDFRLNTRLAYRVGHKWKTIFEPTVRTYNFVVSDIKGSPDGYERSMTVINGKYPGPLIEGNRGDRIIIHLSNQGSSPTSIHFHGLFMNGTNFMDGAGGVAQCFIPSGGQFTYNFTLEGQYGTHWYHSHYEAQYSDGVVGPIVIHSVEEDLLIRNRYDYDMVIMLSDWYHKHSSEYLREYARPGVRSVPPIPDSGLINGAGHFDCSKVSDPQEVCNPDQSKYAAFWFQRNKRYRLRLINIGSTVASTFSIEGHDFTIVEAEGTIVDPVTVDKLSVGLAQRYSIFFETSWDVDSVFLMHSELNLHCISDRRGPVLDPDVQAVVVVTDRSPDDFDDSDDWLFNNTDLVTSLLSEANYSEPDDIYCRGFNDSYLVPSVAVQVPDATHFYRLDISFEFNDSQNFLAYLNSTSWTPAQPATLRQAYDMLMTSNENSSLLTTHEGLLPVGTFGGDQNQMVFNVPKYAVIDLLITQPRLIPHPFHLHGTNFFILDRQLEQFDYSKYGKHVTTNPMRRDTVQVLGYTLIRFIADNPGVWPLHCHLAWHLETGMLAQFSIMADKIPKFDFPRDWMNLCKA